MRLIHRLDDGNGLLAEAYVDHDLTTDKDVLVMVVSRNGQIVVRSAPDGSAFTTAGEATRDDVARALQIIWPIASQAVAESDDEHGEEAWKP